ncbi:MAG: hypothetical protein JHD02_00260 [Thermoleophilaceae bacterium]|nr:hypothetical protein [Thermoleophilaceae bacterium]
MPENANTKVTEEWTYAGRRIGLANNLLFTWLDAKGEERVFSKLKHHALAGVYEIDVDRDEEGAFRGAYFASLHFVKRLSVDDDPRVSSWLVEDRAAFEADEQRKFEARAKRDDQLPHLTLEQLRDHAREHLTPRQRTALTAWLINYIR